MVPKGQFVKHFILSIKKEKLQYLECLLSNRFIKFLIKISLIGLIIQYILYHEIVSSYSLIKF